MRGGVATALLLGGLFGGPACGGEAAGSKQAARSQPAELPAVEPQEIVREHFAAVVAGDCESLRGSLVGQARARFDEVGCQAVIDEYVEHGAQLLGIAEVRKDGRDARRRLVSARLGTEEDERVVVIGVRADGGAWRIDQI
ncbi:MAG: hypothetical protein AB1Z98_10515 [Nannocystaceae bacterium]